MATPAAVLSILVTANTAQATTALATTQGQLKATAATAASTSSVIKSRLATGAKYGALAMAGLGAASVKMAVDFDKSMRNVNSIAQLNERQFAKLEDRVKSLAGRTAQSPQTLAEGLYDLVSSGFNANESMKVLASSARAATAGLTDTATSTKAVAAVLNAYRMPAKKAADVSDTLFQTVNIGVVSFDELASTIGDVLPFASSLGVKLNEVGAATATMTKAGISPAETMTRLKAIMSSLLKPSEALSGALRQMGYESGEALIEQKGLQGALDALAKTTGGSKQAMAALFPNIRALGGALALTGENSKVANKDLAAFADTSGATSKALAEQSKSVAFQWNKLKAQGQALAIDVGDNLIPALRDMLEILTNPKLTLSEKVAKLGTELTKTIEEWGPKVAKAGAAIGLAVVKGIWGAFWDSDLLGKLFIAGTFIRLIGGPGVFGKIGQAIGAKIGTKIGPGVASGFTAAGGWAAALAVIGPLGISQLIDPGETLKDKIERVNKIVDRYRARVAGMTGDLKERYGSLTAAVGAMSDKQQKAYRKAALIAVRNGDITINEWQDMTQALDHATGRQNAMWKRAADVTGEKTKQIKANVGDMTVRVSKSYDNMVRVTGAGIDWLMKNTGDAMKALGLKQELNWNLQRHKTGPTGGGYGNQSRQAGGEIFSVPGYGSGDKVPAMLEPGEVVVNRKAVAAMGGADRVNRINDLIPRFQKGGVAKGAMGAMIGLVNKYERASYPYLWGGGHGGFVNASSPVDCSGFVSDVLHAGGLLSGAPMVSGALMSWGKPASGNEPLVVYANPGHTVMSLNGRVAGTSGSNPGGGAGWIEGGNGASLAPGAKRTMDVAGFVNRIARILLKGPNGPLKDIGQAALDKTRNAANKFLASKQPMGTAGGGDLGPLGKAIVRGRATWFTGGTMASGKNTDVDPGIALNPNPGGPDPGSWNNPTTQRWLADAQQFLVKLGGKQAVLPVLDMGPAGWTGNAIDVDRAGVGRLGYSTSSFPSGTIGTAQAIRRQFGGIVHLAKGGKSDKPGKAGFKPGPTDPAYKRFVKAQRFADKLKALVGEKGRIARLDERIQIAETMAGLDSSELGSDLGPNERQKQIRLNEALLARMVMARKLARTGLHWLDFPKGMSTAAIKPSQLKGLKGRFTQTLLDLTGLTGKSGRIFDTRVALDTLKHTTTSSSAEAMDISGLRSVIEAARYGVFDGYFATGGTIGRGKWGVVGERGPEVVHGPATVTPADAMSVTVENNFDWQGMDLWVETKVNGAIAKREKVRRRQGRQMVR